MEDSTETTGKLGDGNVIELTGKIMVVAIILLLFVVVFVFALHLYAKWFWYRRQETSSADDATTTRRRRQRLDFTSSHQEITIVASLSGGLDPTILETLPVRTFDLKLSKDGFECAVCLCEVSEGQKTRLLPKCNHGFHLDCIDMWFQSHSTCPLCRNPVANRKEPNTSDELHLLSMIQTPIGENPSFPTNVLFWGDESRVSAFSPCLEDENQNSVIPEPPPPSSSASMVSTSNTPEGVSVIDIQRLVNEIDEEAIKFLMPTRIRSLKRLLSGNRRVNNNNPCSSRNLVLELGGRSGQS